jgi:hypothetical protein
LDDVNDPSFIRPAILIPGNSSISNDIPSLATSHQNGMSHLSLKKEEMR